MSMPLFIATLKKNWVLLFVFFAVLIMYTASMIIMYDPNDTEKLMSIYEMLPAEIMTAFGFSSAINSFTSYLASWLYGLLMIAFPMVYSIILGNRLVAKSVDSGSMACLLATPNSRVKIVVTKAVYAVSTIALLQMALFAATALMSEAMLPGALDTNAFFRLNLTYMLVNMAVMSIAFFFSCLFNDAKYSLGFGAGIPIVFLLINMLGGASSATESLKKLSIFGWYDPVELVNGAGTLGVNSAYLGMTTVLFIAGIVIFQRKRLPI